MRARIQFVDVKLYQKANARNAFNLLSEAPNLKKLKFEAGVTSETDPAKAAKTFYSECFKFLKTIGAAKGDPPAGVDILHFTKAAFAPKEGKNTWTDDMVAEFKEALKEKAK